MLTSWLLVAGLSAAQTVQVAVVARGAPAGAVFYAETTWLGDDRTTRMLDDGSVVGDLAGDGVDVAVWSGDPVRVLPVWIAVELPGGSMQTIGGFEEEVNDDDRLVYAVTWDPTPSLRRVPAALTVRGAEVAEAASTAAALGWTGLVFGYVAWLVRARGPR